MIRIDSINSAFGSILEDNNDIEGLVGWSSQDIFQKTGIKNRFISSDQETAETLAVKVVEKIDKENWARMCLKF